MRVIALGFFIKNFKEEEINNKKIFEVGGKIGKFPQNIKEKD